MRISFIGGGNMAQALIAGLKHEGFAMGALTVVEPDIEKRQYLSETYGVFVTDQLPQVQSSEVVVLAVKPQQLRDVCIFLGSILQHQLVISIAAGIYSRDISRWLGGYNTLIRAMPNTPAQVRQGMTGLYAMPEITDAQRAQAETILTAVGKTLWLADESAMDALTAISGSGPAYVFFMIESLMEAAIKLGFSAEQARTLALQTFSGACQLAQESPNSPAVLRSQVTSKGGTTEQGMLALEQADIKAAILAAATAAAKKSAELGVLLGRD